MPQPAHNLTSRLARRLAPIGACAWRQRGLLAVLLLALAVRLVLWAQPLHEPANDEQEYIAVARDLLAGRGWQFYTHYPWLRAPLYPLWLAGSLWLAGGNLHLAALPNILLSVATVGLIVLLARQVAGPRTDAGRVGLLAGLLAALLQTLATFASLAMSETLFSLLWTAALLLVLRWKQGAAGGAAGTRLALLVLAGICAGLAVLTRSLPLAFLPVLLLWLLLPPIGTGGGWLLQRADWPHIRRSFGGGLLLLACALLTIAPWTLRNCHAYGRCILVETGFSYNLWAFNEPRASLPTIGRTLSALPNPAERADEATRRGLARLQEDPAILVRKLWPNWVYLWRVKPIQDRFLLPTYFTDPPPSIFLAALLFDDLLYAVILLAGGVALVWRLRGPGGPAALLALWIAYVVAVSLLTHGEARYRHFIFPALIPYAALGLLGIGQAGGRLRQPLATPWSGWRRRGPRQMGASAVGGLLVAVLLATLLTTYPWEWARRGAGRSLHRLAGDVAAATGDRAGAEVAYRRALAVQQTADLWLAVGGLRLQQGDLSGAETAYRAAWRVERLYVAASVRLGDVLRRQGRTEEARRAFAGYYLSEQQALDWAWHHLTPPPAAQIDVGTRLDYGYVGGMYPAEEQQGTPARWTSGHGRLRLAAPGSRFARLWPAGLAPAWPRQPAGVLLRLRLAAPHPDTSRVPVTICAAGRCQQVVLTPTWRSVRLLLPTPPSDGAGEHATLLVELQSPTFRAPDGRRLGVLVDAATVAWAYAIIRGEQADTR